MAANIDPIFTKEPIVGLVNIATANAGGRDGSGTIGTVITAPVNGMRVHRVVIRATAVTTAGVIRLFIHTGSTYFLWKEILVTAITPSATLASYEYILDLTGELSLVLPESYSIRVSTEKAESFNVLAEGGVY